MDDLRTTHFVAIFSGRIATKKGVDEISFVRHHITSKRSHGQAMRKNSCQILSKDDRFICCREQFGLSCITSSDEVYTFCRGSGYLKTFFSSFFNSSYCENIYTKLVVSGAAWTKASRDPLYLVPVILFCLL